MLSEERKAFERLSFKTVIIVIVLIAAFLLVPLAWNMLSPFIIAIPLAAMLQPVIRFCFTRLKIKKSVSSLILVILLLALVIGILIWVIGLLTNMVNPFLNQSEDIVTTTIGTIRQAVNSLMEYTSENFSAEVQSQISKAMNDMIGDLTKWGISVSTAIGSYLVNLATGFPYFIIYTTFLAMALFFIARDYDDIRSYLPGGKRRNQSSNTTQLTNSAIRSLIGYLRVQGTFSLMVLVVSLIYLNAFRFPYASAIAIVAGIIDGNHLPAHREYSRRSPGARADRGTPAGPPAAGAEVHVQLHRHHSAGKPDRHVRRPALRRHPRPDRRPGADVRPGGRFPRKTVRIHEDGFQLHCHIPEKPLASGGAGTRRSTGPAGRTGRSGSS